MFTSVIGLAAVVGPILGAAITRGDWFELGGVRSSSSMCPRADRDRRCTPAHPEDTGRGALPHDRRISLLISAAQALSVAIVAAVISTVDPSIGITSGLESGYHASLFVMMDLIVVGAALTPPTSSRTAALPPLAADVLTRDDWLPAPAPCTAWLRFVDPARPPSHVRPPACRL